MKEFYFERLDVWQDTRKFIKDIYAICNSFPADEKFGMISQMKRASLSIAANIAEGMSRQSEKEKARFIAISFGSAIEVLNFLIIAKDFEWIEEEEYIKVREKLEKITNMLNSLYVKFKK